MYIHEITIICVAFYSHAAGILCTGGIDSDIINYSKYIHAQGM